MIETQQGDKADARVLENRRRRSIAIVSGKGGSGKTISVAMMARVLDEAGIPVVLVDGDAATAGLTLYLGPKYLDEKKKGISQLSPQDLQSSDHILDLLQPIRYFKTARFVGMGEHRTIRRGHGSFDGVLVSVIDALKKELVDSWILVDCRGGIDEDSLAICHAVDEIIVVAEQDPTSFQATDNVAEVLREDGLDRKMKGFFFNKVFEDPERDSISGANTFGIDYLYSVPFDANAAYSFYRALIPKVEESHFATHIWEILRISSPGTLPKPKGRVFTRNEFRGLGFFGDTEVNRGSAVVGVVILLLAVVLIIASRLYARQIPNYPEIASFVTLVPIVAAAIALVAFAGTFFGVRRWLGKTLSRGLRGLQPSGPREE